MIESIILVAVLFAIAFAIVCVWARNARIAAEREVRRIELQAEIRKRHLDDIQRLSEKRKAFDQSVSSQSKATLSTTTTSRNPTRVVDDSDDLANSILMNQMIMNATQPTTYVEAPAMPIYSAPEPVTITSLPSSGYSYSSSDSYSSSSSWSSSSDSSYSSSDSGSSFSSD